MRRGMQGIWEALADLGGAGGSECGLGGDWGETSHLGLDCGGGAAPG